MSRKIRHIYEFGSFRYSEREKCLRLRGEIVPVSPKALEVLEVLLRWQPETVTREELLGTVWGDTFVEEANLTVAVSNLRSALKESSGRTTKFIRTIPKRGYRFAADVRKISEDAQEKRSESTSADKPAVTQIASRRYLAVLIVLSLFFATSFSAWWSYGETDRLPVVPVAEREIGRLAVLPLRDLDKASGEKRSVALGLTDSLIGRLGKLRRFEVAPFGAVERFPESGMDELEFGRHLRADAVLTGTIQISKGVLRVNVRLLDTRDGALLWGDTFRDDEKDLFKLQDFMALRIGHFVVKKLTRREEELVARRSTLSPKAYHLYLTALESWLRRDNRIDKIDYYRAALTLDPNFALANLGIADYYALAGESEKAEKALARALANDPDLPGSLETKGFLSMFHYWDWDGAREHLEMAITLSPKSAKAHHWYGVYLAFQKRFPEAESEMQRALELDPTSLNIATDIAELKYFQRRYAESEIRLAEIIAIDPSYDQAHHKLALVRHKMTGSFFRVWLAKQIAVIEEDLDDSSDPEIAARAAEYRQIQVADDQRRMFRVYWATLYQGNAMQDPNRYVNKARYLMMAGDQEKVLDLLEKSLETREFLLPFIAIDPIWDDLRDDPQFQKIVRKIGLPLGN